MTFQLTDEQRAVLAFGVDPTDPPNLLNFAVAGAGKTEITVRKIGALIAAGARPDRILLTTFSKRGAADMRRRLALLGVSGRVEAKTLHAVARKLLWDAPEMKRDPQLPPKWACANAVNRVLKRFERTGMKDLPKFAAVRTEITLAKASLIWPGKNSDGPWFGEWKTADGVRYPGYHEWAMTREREPLDPKAADIFEACYKEVEDIFRAPEAAKKIDNKSGRVLDLPFFAKLVVSDQGERKRRSKIRFVTFDDMIAMVGRSILERAPFLACYRGQYEWVMVDECQDNSEGQWVMARFLADKHLMVIGDDMQAIFGFRGARPDLMHSFARETTTKTQPLSSNFRCGQEILDAANNLLDYAGERLFKGKLVCGRGTHAKVTVEIAADPEDEARRVAEEIEAGIKLGVSPEAYAVLYRLNAQSGPLEIECIKKGIPYKVAGRSFFNRPEVDAAIGYVACALDADDRTGWKACANVPSRMLGQVFFEAVPTMAAVAKVRREGGLGGQGRGFWSEGATAAERAVKIVKEFLDGTRATEAESGVAAAIEWIFESLGVRKFFREDGADDEAESDVDEACAALTACAGAMTDARKLVDYARSMHKVGREDVGEHEGERMAEPRVTLSTVHKAKGLEWCRVFTVGMVEGLFPFGAADIEEERRLAYVAITRARDEAFVMGYRERGENKPVQPSKFLFEMKLLAAENAAERVLEPVVLEPATDGNGTGAETAPEAAP